MSNNKVISLKKQFLTFAIITLILELAAIVVPQVLKILIDDFEPSRIVALIPLLLHFSWFFILVNDSKLFKSLTGYFLIFMLFIYGLGYLAKLEHWWWATIAILISSTCILIVYSIRFFFKKKKSLLDLVKYIFVIFYLLLGFLIIDHRISAVFKYIIWLIFYVLIFIFAHEKDKGEIETELLSFEKQTK